MAQHEHITLTIASGSPVRVTSTQTDPTLPLWVRFFEVQLDSDDAGTAYVGAHGVVTGKTNCHKSVGPGQVIPFAPSERARFLGECLDLSTYDVVGVSGQTIHIEFERG